MTIVRHFIFGALAILILSHPARSQEAADGDRLFRTRCGACHSLDAGQNRIGPSLAGVFNRGAGKAEGARYSDGLRNSGLIWDDATLDRYLANPKQVVPSTTMVFSLSDEAQRRAIIAFLRDQAASSPK